MSDDRSKDTALVSAIQVYAKRAAEDTAAGNIEEAIQSHVSLGTLAKRLAHRPNGSFNHFLRAYDLTTELAGEHSNKGNHLEAANSYSWAASLAKENLTPKHALDAAALANSENLTMAGHQLKEIKDNFYSPTGFSDIKNKVYNVAYLLRAGSVIGRSNGMDQGTIDSQLVTAHKLFLGFGHKMEALSTVPHMSLRIRQEKLKDVIDQISHHSSRTSVEERELLQALDWQKRGFHEIAGSHFFTFAMSLTDSHSKRFFVQMSAESYARASSEEEKSGIPGRMKRAAELLNKSAQTYDRINDPLAKPTFERSKQMMNSYESWKAIKSRPQMIKVS